MANYLTLAYEERLPAVPDWLNKGDNAWQLTAVTLVCLQSMPGLVILYASIVKNKWAVSSAFMALCAFVAVLICWVLFCYRLAFGDKLFPFWGKVGLALDQGYLTRRAAVPESTHLYSNGTIETDMNQPFFPMASLVYFQFSFATITTILVAGSVLERMNIKAWMAFVPLWLTFCHTVCAYSLWGGGFLYHWGVIDYSGGYAVHLASGISGFTAAYWSIGVVQSWAAIVFGLLSGIIPWFSMIILHKKSTSLQKVDDTHSVFYTHAVARILGGALTGLLAKLTLCSMLLPVKDRKGAFYTENARGELVIGDNAVHSENSYVPWSAEERYDTSRHDRDNSTHAVEVAKVGRLNGARRETVNV